MKHSLAHGYSEYNAQNYLEEHPLPIRCTSCNRVTKWLTNGTAYRSALVANIDRVLEEFVPKFVVATQKFEEHDQSARARGIKLILDRYLGSLRETRSSLKALDGFQASPTREIAEPIVAAIRLLIKNQDDIPELLQDPWVGIFQDAILVPLNQVYSSWASGGAIPEDATAAPIDAFNKFIQSVDKYTTEELPKIILPRSKGFYDRYSYDKDLADLEIEAKMLLGDLNEAAFDALKLDACCRTEIADAVRRGLIDPALSAVDERLAYNPQYWEELATRV